MKYECKKDVSALLNAKQAPAVVSVPSWNFIAVEGAGDPNGEDFSQRVIALYTLSYTLKFAYKAACAKDAKLLERNGYDDFSVFPLEGVWDTANPGDLRDKASFRYTIMIRQPDFIGGDMFEAARVEAARKRPHPLLGEAAFVSVEEGLCAQMLHVGPYDDEPATFEKMDAFIAKQGCARDGHVHREIYLGDPRRTAPEKLRTILRYRIKPL